jgi:hypothetical protein
VLIVVPRPAVGLPLIPAQPGCQDSYNRVGARARCTPVGVGYQRTPSGSTRTSSLGVVTTESWLAGAHGSVRFRGALRAWWLPVHEPVHELRSLVDIAGSDDRVCACIYGTFPSSRGTPLLYGSKMRHRRTNRAALIPARPTSHSNSQRSRRCRLYGGQLPVLDGDRHQIGLDTCCWQSPVSAETFVRWTWLC